MAKALDLIYGIKPEAVLADRAYDADRLMDVIERFFNKLKRFRRVATRYNKLLVNFMGFVKIAAIAIWLR